ncbi:MAG: sugar phosphate isomerase/epimerase [Chthoniobacterales bacterium]
MKINQVAAQLYTARKYTQTLDGLADVLKKIRAIGYEAVQVSATCPFEPEDLLRFAKDADITICSLHDKSKEILDDPERIAQRLVALGNVETTVYAHPDGIDVSNPPELEELVKRLDHAGQVVHNAGRILCYHNHSLEFTRHGNSGKLVLEYIFDKIDPKYLQAELDTYWVQHGGCDIIDWIKRMNNRLPILHIKDYASYKGQPVICEIGSGNLNWRKIIDAAEESGCKWFAVEQDFPPVDALESLKISFDYISKNLIS